MVTSQLLWTAPFGASFGPRFYAGLGAAPPPPPATPLPSALYGAQVHPTGPWRPRA